MTTKHTPLASLVGYARARLAYTEPRDVPRLVFKFVRSEVRSRVWDRLEQRVYVFHAERIGDLPRAMLFRRDCWDDLERYQRAAYHDQLPRDEFLRVAEQRLHSGQHAYTFVEDGVLMHYGWLGDRQTFSPDRKIGLAFVPPEDSAVVWDNFSHPRARGRGLMRQFLYQAVHDAVEIAHAKRVYGYVFSYNTPSARSCEKAGLQYAGSLVREVRLGRVRRYAVAHEQPFTVRPI